MSSRQPLIGLVAQYNSENPHRYFIHRAYVQAIADAGGVPLIVPPQQAEQLVPSFPRCREWSSPAAWMWTPFATESSPKRAAARSVPSGMNWIWLSPPSL